MGLALWSNGLGHLLAALLIQLSTDAPKKAIKVQVFQPLYLLGRLG